jgi:hypothetical protein
MIDPRVLLLAAGSLLFGSAIVGEFTSDSDSAVVPIAPAARHAEPAAPPQRSSPPVEQLISASLARPLFSPNRRPAEIAQSTNTDLDDKRLAGIVIESERRLAIFAVSGAKPLTVGEGDSIDGWRVESITPSEISLVGAAGTRTMQPKMDPSPPPPEPRKARAKEGGRAAAQAKQAAAAPPPHPAAAKTPEAAPRPAVRPPRGNGAPPQAAAPKGAQPAQTPPAGRQTARTPPKATETAGERQ